MSEIEKSVNGLASSKKGFFEKLANGDFGLAKTFWLYNVLVTLIVKIVFEVFIEVSQSIGLLVVFLLAYTAYEIPVLMGIWRAANKYQGPKIWAVLARIEVVLGAIWIVIGLLFLLLIMI